MIAAFVYHHCVQSWNAIPAIIHHAPVLGETGEMNEIDIAPRQDRRARPSASAERSRTGHDRRHHPQAREDDSGHSVALRHPQDAHGKGAGLKAYASARPLIKSWVSPLAFCSALASSSESVCRYSASQAQTSAAQNSRTMVAPIVRADRRRRCFHDFKRGWQERQLFVEPLVRTPKRDDASHRLGGRGGFNGLHRFLPATDATMHSSRRS